MRPQHRSYSSNSFLRARSLITALVTIGHPIKPPYTLNIPKLSSRLLHAPTNWPLKVEQELCLAEVQDSIRQHSDHAISYPINVVFLSHTGPQLPTTVRP